MSFTTTREADRAITTDQLRDLLEVWPGTRQALAIRASISARTLRMLDKGNVTLTRGGAVRLADTYRKAAEALTTAADLLTTDCMVCRAELAGRELTDRERQVNPQLRCSVHDGGF